MVKVYDAKCPYCGQYKMIEVHIDDLMDSIKSKIIRCDNAQSGCGKRYIVDVGITVAGKTLKIEGEEDV